MVEFERAVDVYGDVARDAHIREQGEPGGSLPHGKHAYPVPGEPASDPADRHDAQQRRYGPVDAAVAAAAGQRPALGEHRPVRDEVEDQVVGLIATGKVMAAVVDHLVARATA